jgi:hypothetical protein
MFHVPPIFLFVIFLSFSILKYSHSFRLSAFLTIVSELLGSATLRSSSLHSNVPMFGIYTFRGHPLPSSLF